MNPIIGRYNFCPFRSSNLSKSEAFCQSLGINLLFLPVLFSTNSKYDPNSVNDDTNEAHEQI